MTDSRVSPDGPASRHLLSDAFGDVDQIGENYLDLLHAGHAPSRQEILQAYRHLLERLEKRLALIELMFGKHFPQ